MLKKYHLILSALFLLTLNSCETKFSVSNDYQRIPIIFGLLDQDDSIHYVKITRTFLGEGNNYDFAKIDDSSYFNSVDAKIIESYNGYETGRVWLLHDTIIPNKENGIFYGPEQKVYVFYSNDLDEKMDYKISADLDDGSYHFDATTNMINGFKYAPDIENGTFKITFGYNFSSDNDEYGLLLSTYTEGKNALLYTTQLDLNYREFYQDGTSSDFTIPWTTPNTRQNDPEKPALGMFRFAGARFYDILSENIEEDENIDRVFLGIDLTTAIAHKNFTKFMEISKPSTSITQVKPEYTNIISKNGAIGIFSSRNIVRIKNIQLSSGSIVELCQGQITGTLNFCSPLPEHANKPFYCN